MAEPTKVVENLRFYASSVSASAATFPIGDGLCRHFRNRLIILIRHEVTHFRVPRSKYPWGNQREHFTVPRSKSPWGSDLVANFTLLHCAAKQVPLGDAEHNFTAALSVLLRQPS